MLPPLIRQRQRTHPDPRSGERGFTMALVTVALVAIIALAALSIDIGTLYQAKAEAQRAADAAALTAARMISISGITGDPTNASSSWQTVCGGTSSPATLAAIKVAQQNLISGVAATSADVIVKYGGGSAGATATNCIGRGIGLRRESCSNSHGYKRQAANLFRPRFYIVPERQLLEYHRRRYRHRRGIQFLEFGQRSWQHDSGAAAMREAFDHPEQGSYKQRQPVCQYRRPAPSTIQGFLRGE